MIKCTNCKNPAKYLVAVWIEAPHKTAGWTTKEEPRCGVHSEEPREKIGMERFHIADKRVVRRKAVKRNE